MNILTVLIILALIATIISLVLGLRSMGKGGEYDKQHADQFMSMRIIFQGIALVLLIITAIMSL
ncbi:MAG: twin transmembrane helix small protein [Gammaproteobacteria bacterium]|nr:twin transmembrane helix small protein [Gammaproteobacteria bacterium]